MPRIQRLKTRAQFLSVAAAKRKWVMPGLILQARPQTADTSARDPWCPDDVVRVGFTASRKVGNAVARNRVKRRLRAAAAKVLEKSAKSGFDYVVIGRRATLERDYGALVEDMQQAVTRLKSAPKQGRSQKDEPGTRK